MKAHEISFLELDRDEHVPVVLTATANDRQTCAVCIEKGRLKLLTRSAPNCTWGSPLVQGELEDYFAATP
ncbi:MAG: hypothetical protein ACE5HT_15945 [Gemmatimonadales bacterium]